ncbi:MAG: hypothetical protein CMK38_06905, partial [Porticoccaceae bacterium]|nr:hypothetical protein [Porticoccaceae bacterium]
NVWQAVLSRNVFASGFFCLLLGICFLTLPEMQLINVAALFMVSRIAALLSSKLLSEKTLSIRSLAFFRLGIPTIKDLSFRNKSQAWFFAGQMTETLNRHIIYLLLGVFASIEEVGFITFITKVCLPIEIIYVVLQQQAVHMVSGYISKGNWHALGKLMILISGCGIGFSLVYVILLGLVFPDLLDLMKLKAYNVTFSHCLILLGANALNAATSVSGPILQLSGLERVKFYIGAGAVIIQMSLIFVSFQFSLGLTGTCLALGIGVSLRAIAEGIVAVNHLSKVRTA